MNKIDIVKKAATIIVGLGASKISSGIIKNNVAVESVIEKITVTSASIVIGMMTGEATRKFTETKIDEVVAAIDKARNNIKEAQQTKED